MQSAPSPPAFIWQQPSAPPAQTDPSVEEAARRERVIEAGLEGRGSTLLAGGAQTDPTRRVGSRLLGDFGALG
ncbi:hypothetical protein [Reyranella sp.]|uniref:hypothetical protein n=1 Tax=Reyranella sp. TaxID=1929291 RepID=UPI003D0B8441